MHFKESVKLAQDSAQFVPATQLVAHWHNQTNKFW
jgi:hypothetical protein